MTSKAIELFTTLDASWMDYALMFAASVRKATNAPLHYTIFYSGRVDEIALHEWGRRRNIRLIPVDFDARVKQRGLEGRLRLDVPGNATSACAYWGRYCAEFLFDDLPDRLIYADVDMYALDDLSSLMEVDLEGLPVGAVRYPNDELVKRTGIPAGRYVNNGLLVFDTKTFNGRQCIHDMQSALEDDRTVFGPQCAFNIAMQPKIKLIDNRWNVQGEWRVQLQNDAKLIHFTGAVKPWHTLSVDPMRWQIRDLLRDVGCPAAWRPDCTISKALRLTVRRMRATWRRD